MGILKYVYQKIEQKLLFKIANVYNSSAFGDYINSGGISYTSDKQELSAYEKIVWFSACIDVIAQDTTSKKFHFVRTGTDKIIEYKDIPESILLPIEKSFGKLTFSQLLELIISHKKLTGNGYLFKAQTSAFGAINNITDQFYPLNPAWVKPYLSQNKLKLIYYKVNLEDGSTFNIPPDNIIHFLQNPIFNPFVGVGNVSKARLIAENETQSDEYINEFMENKASPSLAITEETRRNTSDIERLTDLLSKKYEKKKNAGKILYMAGEKIKVQQLSFSQKDMQFLEQKEFNRQAILSINKVPGIILGIPEGANKAIAQVLSNNYFKRTINPEIVAMENTFNDQFIHQIDQNISIVFDKYNVGDTKEIEEMIASGIITPNRAAQMLGQEISDKKENDKYYIKNTLIPLELSGSQLNSFNESKEKEIKKEYNKIDLNNPKNVTGILDYFEKSATRSKKFQKKYLKQSLEDRNIVEDKYTPELAKFFQRSLNRILKNIKANENLLKFINLEKKELEENDILLIYNINEDNFDLENVARRMHTSGVQRSVAGLNAIMNENVSFSINNHFIKAAIGSLGKKIKRINEATRNEVERILLKEIDEGGNVVTLTEALQKKFTDFQGYRARRIARTEARIAWDRGAEVMYNEVGVKTVDIVGCTQFEIDSDCGKQNVAVYRISSLNFHPNHIGTPAPSIEP